MTEIRCRMETAKFSIHAGSKMYDDDYSESLSYDANGNITGIVRMGYVDEDNASFGEVDDLRMSHDGNQLAHVENSGNPWALTPHFTKTKDETEEYRFNANGALAMDKNRGIISIQYDNMGHPCQVLFRDGSYTRYVYAADGTKLRVTHGKAIPGQTLEWGETKTLAADRMQSVNTTDYWSNVLCENGRPTTVLSNGRYILLNEDSTLTWCSVEKDHLGSSRVVRETGTGANRSQINHYYPFGNTFGEYNHCDENCGLQRYKFNGKELDLVHGLRLYDYGARMYDQILDCWTSVDPLAENHFGESPYMFCADNPMNNIDLNGMDYWFTNNPSQIQSFMDNVRMGTNADMSAWQHSTDADFTSNLFYNDKTNSAWYTWASEENGEFVLTSKQFKGVYATSWGKILGNSNNIIGGLGAEFKKQTPRSRVGSNFRFYFKNEGERPFYGNQYVKTYSILKLGKGISGSSNVVSLILGGCDVYQSWHKDGGKYGLNTEKALVTNIGGWAGAWAGGQAGAYLGSYICPPYGTIVGGIGGAFLGGLGTNWLIDEYYSNWR